MKLHKYIPAFAMLAVSAAAMVGCTEDPELPMIVPEGSSPQGREHYHTRSQDRILVY